MTRLAGRIRTGLDRLLEDPAALAGRRYGLLTHLAAITADGTPAHLALALSQSPPVRLFAPEHGLSAVAQDMEATADDVDTWTGLPVVSLYGADETSLVPDRSRFDDLDLLVVDLQDVGARYYTYAATAIWAARVAAEAGCRILVLDRPNPLGGIRREGNLRRDGFDSFVGAFAHPVVHGLTLGELARLELAGGAAASSLDVLPMSGWRRELTWDRIGRAFVAPSPNMPDWSTALVYPGLCLIEATTISEGRGTTRPFRLVGAPGLDALALTEGLERRGLPGVAFLPTRFRPEFQKHAGRTCSGVEVVVTDTDHFEPYRTGVELLVELSRHDAFGWRQAPYEFVSDRPAIDLLTGDSALREAIEAGREPTDWMAGWRADEEAFAERSLGALLYD